jgi:hypothetical protein
MWHFDRVDVHASASLSHGLVSQTEKRDLWNQFLHLRQTEYLAPSPWSATRVQPIQHNDISDKCLTNPACFRVFR